MSAELQQQTQEWLNFRSTRIGGSDAPIIMGVSDFSTPHQLWKVKSGLAQSSGDNFATRRGNRFEPVARSLYEIDTGLDLPPAIVVHPRYNWMMASMDGLNKERTIGLEIKIAGRKVFEAAKRGEVYEGYYPQVQHQIEVTGIKENHFFVCYAEKDKRTQEDRIVDAALVKAVRDEEYIEKMLVKEKQFYRYMIEKIAPPLTRKDILAVDDIEALAIVSEETVDKEKLVEVLSSKYGHNNYELNGHRLWQTERGHWTLTLNKG